MKLSGVHYTLIAVGLVVLYCVAAFVGAYNTGNASDRRIEAEYTNLQNVLSQFSLQAAEAAQIPDMAKTDFIEVANAYMQGRYGDDGSSASFQWIQEQNPNLSPELYLNVQKIVSTGRDRFETAQTRFIDIKRSYETRIGSLVGGFWIRTAGFPRINLDDFNIVTSGFAQDAFATGTDNGLQFN